MAHRPSWGMRACLAWAVLILTVVAAAAQPAIGPYVQNVGTDNATVCWATPAGSVSYTPSGNEPGTVNRYVCHSVLLQDLDPGKTYTYTVTLPDGAVLGTATFTTVPEGEHPFSFAIVGDTQNLGNLAHPATVKRLLVEKPDMVFNTGDLVSDGRDMVGWDNFFRINAELMRTTPYYPALGNHDRHSDLYFDFFALPGNEAFYSFNRGAAHFVVLDSPGPYFEENNQPSTPEAAAREAQAEQRYWQRQLRWLREDLAAAKDAKYVFVFFHYPPYSVKKSRMEGAAELRQVLGTVFQDYQVSAVFNGHDHHYHRALAGGVQYVTAGTSGGSARPVDGGPLPETVKSAAVVTYVSAQVAADQATVRILDLEGKEVDSFTVKPRAVK